MTSLLENEDEATSRMATTPLPARHREDEAVEPVADAGRHGNTGRSPRRGRHAVVRARHHLPPRRPGVGRPVRSQAAAMSRVWAEAGSITPLSQCPPSAPARTRSGSLPRHPANPRGRCAAPKDRQAKWRAFRCIRQEAAAVVRSCGGSTRRSLGQSLASGLRRRGPRSDVTRPRATRDVARRYISCSVPHHSPPDSLARRVGNSRIILTPTIHPV